MGPRRLLSLLRSPRSVLSTGGAEGAVFDRVLGRLRRAMREDRFVVTLHAADELAEDDLLIEDIEHCVFTGRVEVRQWDAVRFEWKYALRGKTLNGDACVVVLKQASDDRVTIVTVFLDRETE